MDHGERTRRGEKRKEERDSKHTADPGSVNAGEHESIRLTDYATNSNARIKAATILSRLISSATIRYDS